MGKLCLIFNSAPRYREAIFKAIDQNYDCDWYFGPTKSDIKEMDVSLLKNVKYYKTYGNPQKWYFKRQYLRLLFKKKYQSYFMIAETRSISDWLFFLFASLFFPKKKIFIWTHGWYGKESGRDAKMKLWLYRHVSGVFLYGNYARKLLIKEGISPDKLFTIHNSLHYDEQKSLREQMLPSTIYKDHFKNDDPTIIFIGRLTRVKQLDMLINAVADLKEKGENYNITFIGDGVDRANLEQLTKYRGIQNSVWFYGACYDEVKNAELVYNADLCVAPGNIGLTAMHVLMFGCPAITHGDFKWQMPEFEAIKTGKTGDYFERGNIQSLEQTISLWFQHKKGMRGEVRQACYQEMDTQWNPYFQMDVVKKNLVVN